MFFRHLNECKYSEFAYLFRWKQHGKLTSYFQIYNDECEMNKQMIQET